METRFPCQVVVTGDKPETFVTCDAFAIMSHVCDLPTSQVQISFELAHNQRVAISYNFKEGSADTIELDQEGKPSSITNVYSFQTNPLEEAMSVIAKLHLFKWLSEKLGDAQVKMAIENNLIDCSSDSVKNTYHALLIESRITSFFSKFSEKHKIVRDELLRYGFYGEGVNGFNAVSDIQQKIESRLESSPLLFSETQISNYLYPLLLTSQDDLLGFVYNINYAAGMECYFF